MKQGNLGAKFFIPKSKHSRTWASPEMFPGGQSRHFVYFFWLLTMQRKLTYTKKENVQCYGNSCIKCFPCKNTLHWANVCFSEHGYFKTEL